MTGSWIIHFSEISIKESTFYDVRIQIQELTKWSPNKLGRAVDCFLESYELIVDLLSTNVESSKMIESLTTLPASSENGNRTNWEHLNNCHTAGSSTKGDQQLKKKSAKYCPSSNDNKGTALALTMCFVVVQQTCLHAQVVSAESNVVINVASHRAGWNKIMK